MAWVDFYFLTIQVCSQQSHTLLYSSSSVVTNTFYISRTVKWLFLHSMTLYSLDLFSQEPINQRNRDLIELRSFLQKQVEELQKEIEARDLGLQSAQVGTSSPPRVASPINAWNVRMFHLVSQSLNWTGTLGSKCGAMCQHSLPIRDGQRNTIYVISTHTQLRSPRGDNESIVSERDWYIHWRVCAFYLYLKKFLLGCGLIVGESVNTRVNSYNIWGRNVKYLVNYSPVCGNLIHFV